MDTLKDYTYTMESCNCCGQCRFILGPKMKGWEYAEICPIYSRYQYEAYSGQGMINMAQEVLEGKLDYEPGMIEHIYTCTTCGACDINCKSVRDMEVLDTILALRARCVADGHGPMPAHRVQADHVDTSHNIYGEPHEQRFNWLNGDSAIRQGVEVAYFVGCATAYKSPDIARNTVKLLEAGGMAITVMSPDEYCCGAPFWRTGQRDRAMGLATHNLKVIKEKGLKTLITSCAECFGTFRGFYPRLEKLDFEVVHISQVIYHMIQERKIKLSKSLDMAVTYHDPCLLGRLSELYVPWHGEIKAFGYHAPPKQWRRGTHGIYDAPREVLKAIPGIELLEMTRNAENAFCCGNGGGVWAAFPEFARWTAKERVGEARSTGAEALVSCCPWCESGFKGAMEADEGKIAYYDLTELVVQAL